MGTMGQSITLANSIIGVGILAMPFCFQQCGVLLATVILILMGLISRLCCYFLLKSALLARRRNFEFLAFHVFGSAGKFAVEVGIIGFLMGTCIAYFVVVGDLGPQIISKMFNINQSDMLRTSIMVIVSLVCVLPLGLLRNVDSLSNVSAATIGFYFCLVMKVIAEAATVLAGGAWAERVQLWRPAGVLQCVPIFSMALFCQTQLFEIFESLPSLSLEKMNLVTKNAINICTGVYFTLGLFGYIAFNTREISGNILMSLSPTMANDVIKLGFVMSLAFSFPLIIFPCRASLYSLLYKKVHSSHHDHIINHSIPEGSFRRITVGIVACALGASLVLPNIELVLGLVGSTIGVLVCLVFPATCFLHLTFKNTNERLLAKGILILGLIIMVLGTYANLQAAENQVDKYDEKYITKERIDKIVEDFFENMEKNNDVKLKPEPNGNFKEDTKKVNGDIIKESVVLPPNPVPPESQSNEKNERNNAEIKNIQNIKEVLPKPIQDTLDKVSESHPKNLNKGNEAKLTNRDKNNKENLNKQKDTQNNYKKTKEDAKPQANEEKINIIKQQKLIETIKQHGEEQKELIKEQKEILSEIYKTKQELEKNKNDAANEEAKKIAVESIKKIANIALQSLAGVSEKPDQAAEEKKPGALEKLADEAVQEIAQKAVETIEAIKEIKEKPEKPIKLPNPVLSNDIPASNGMAPVNNIGIIDNQNAPVNLPNPALPISNNNLAQVNQNGNNFNAVNSQVQNNININQQQNLPPVNLPQPVQSLNQPNGQVASNNDASNIVQVGPSEQVAVNNGQVAQNIGQVANNVDQAAQSINQNANIIGQAPQNIVQAPQNIVPVNNNPVASNILQPASNNQANIPPAAANIPEPANIVKRVAPELNPAQPEANVNSLNNHQVINQKVQTNQVVQNEVNQNQQPRIQNVKPQEIVVIQKQQPIQNVKSQENVVKEHSHSPDEPQSYKQGEDTQKRNNIQQAPVNNVIDQNVPLAVAMNGNSQINNQPNNIPKTNEINNNIQNNNQNAQDVQTNQIPNNQVEVVDKQDNVVYVRQKREVVDCTEKSALKPEDKEICKALIDVPILKIVDNNVDDILSSKVDLNEVGLSKTLPILPNGINHLSRSLKSVDDDKR